MRAMKRLFKTSPLMALLAFAGVFPCSLSAQSVTHSYDARGRLVATDFGGGSDISYVYDGAGNIVTAIDSGPANTLWITIRPEGAGTVSGAGISCPGDCKESFSGSPQLTLTATAQPGFAFLAWGGDWTALPNPSLVTMDSDKRITAYFGDPGGSTDSDGVADSTEMGPEGNDPSYDGDDNGVADYLEARVTSLPTFTGDGYATLAVPEGLTLSGVAAVDDPAPDHLFPHAFPLGFFDFTILGLDPGGCTTMTMILNHPDDPLMVLDTYDKYGSYPGHPDPAWYGFEHDGSVGAEIDSGDTKTTIELAFCDAERGDDVLSIDSQVIDVGGPVHIRCYVPPGLNGVVAIENQSTEGCGLLLTWPEGPFYCGTGFVYNLYRSTTSGFTPGPENIIEACFVGDSYLDNEIDFGVEYFYRLVLEDNSGEGDGPCFSGNVNEGPHEVSGIALGEESLSYENTLTTIDDFVIEPGPNDSGTDTWIFPFTAWSNSPPSSVAVFSEPAVKDQLLVLTAQLSIQPGGFSYLEFFISLFTEPGRDGGVLEVTTNDGATWFDILAGDGASIPANPNRFVSNGYNSILATGNGNPLPGRAAWSDDIEGWVVIDISDFGSHSVRFRWRFGCDASVAQAGSGWGLDDVIIRHIGDCSTLGLIFADGFESGTTDAW